MKTSSFAGKVAAVTGAGSGIGQALAMALARRDCFVAASDVNIEGLRATRDAIGERNCSIVRLDVTDGNGMHTWARDVALERGKVNLVFNNAGIAYGATVAGGDEEEMRRVMDIDFWGVVHGTRAFLPFLAASGDGHVVNISSIAGILAFPGQCAYNAAKFAVRGYTEALRIECEMTGAAVSATCVHPGGIRTNIASTTRVHESLAVFGVEPQALIRNFSKHLRMSPHKAADIILHAVQRNARRVLVGADAHALDLMHRLIPGRYHAVMARVARHMIGAPASDRA